MTSHRRPPGALSLLALTVSAALAAPALSAEGPGKAWEIANLHLQHGHYLRLQEKFFSGIRELSLASEANAFDLMTDDAAKLRASLYISFGMPEEAHGILKSLARRDPATDVPHQAWINLAYLYFARGRLVEAEEALAPIDANAPAEIKAQRDVLLGNIYVSRSRHSDAVGVLKGTEVAGIWAVYARYNLAAALFTSGRNAEAAAALDQVATTKLDHPEAAGLRDRANLDLGYLALRDKKADQARAVFERIGNGAYASQAALARGWAALAAGQPKAALGHWQPLAQGNDADPAVMEALLAIPYAQFQLDAAQDALQSYEEARRRYRAQSAQVQSALAHVESGDALEALLAAGPPSIELGTSWRIERAPRGPSKPFLPALAATYRFQERLKDYRELIWMQALLQSQERDIAAFRDLVKLRQETQRKLAPQIKAHSDAARLNALREKLAALKQELVRIEQTGDIAAVAPAQEYELWRLLDRVQFQLNRLRDVLVEGDLLELKQQRMRGILFWNLTRDFSENLKRVKESVTELEGAIGRVAALQAQVAQNSQLLDMPAETVAEVERADRARAHLIDRLRSLEQQHRTWLQAQATAALRDRDAALNVHMLQAQFGMAQIYDRQARAGKPYDKQALEQALSFYGAVADAQLDTPVRRDALLRLADLELFRAQRGAAGTAKIDYSPVIKRYEQVLRFAPDAPGNDRVLYRLAQAYQGNSDVQGVLGALDRIVARHGNSELTQDAQFRRGELLFALSQFDKAAEAYGALIVAGPKSEFYERALYKHAWAMYKQSLYTAALDSAYALFARKLAPGSEAGAEQDAALTADMFRLASLTHAELGGVRSLAAYGSSVNELPEFEYRLYQELAAYYRGENRIQDAADTYRAFVTRFPDSVHAPAVQAQAIQLLGDANFIALQVEAKAQFVEAYEPSGAYWKNNTSDKREEVDKLVRSHLTDLTRYYHARARQAPDPADVTQAERWYRKYLEAYPGDAQAPEANFLYAELLYDAGRFEEAAAQYQRTAYDYPPHARSAEAAYASLLAHRARAESLAEAERGAALRRSIASAQRFADKFPQDARIPAALTRAAEDLYALGDEDAAVAMAQRVTVIPGDVAPALKRSAWSIIGHVAFDKDDFKSAENAYQQALASGDTQSRKTLEERLAASIYKQGEQAQKAGDVVAATQHFLRAIQAVPASSIAATASYDAAANLMAQRDWPKAIETLLAFRRNHPNHPLQGEVNAKLATAYREQGDYAHAAEELQRIARSADDAELRRQAAWEAAEMFDKAGQKNAAAEAYQAYVAKHAQPFELAVEARSRLAAYYASLGDARRQQALLADIVGTDLQAGGARTERTRYLAAHASLQLAEVRYAAFSGVKLTEPLKVTLPQKRQAMEEALQAYGKAAEYGVADVTTAATFRIAQLYGELAQALLKSQRPADLGQEELEQYNVLLEEQAYPFEEKAISIHESNVARASAGVYDEWVKRSYDALRLMLPARYAKLEKGEAYFDATP